MKLINRTEQIEKMAKERREIKDIMKLLDKCVSLNPMCKSEVANVLYGNNYRKIPEDSVVLSMEEYKKLKGSYKGKKRWYARITVNNETIELGYYDTKEEAIFARQQAEIKYFGEFSPLSEQKNTINEYWQI